MKDDDKLRILIPHWIEHNQEHAAEFRRWAEEAGDAAEDIRVAAEAMAQANMVLENALEKLGGPLEHHHHHHQDH